MAPITKPIIGEHACVLPAITTLVSAGYLCGTEWTCDTCGEVYTMTQTSGTMPVWVSNSAPQPEQPLPPDVPEVELPE